MLCYLLTPDPMEKKSVISSYCQPLAEHALENLPELSWDQTSLLFKIFSNYVVLYINLRTFFHD